MPGIPAVLEMLDRIKLIHEKKNEDYAAPGKSFENFTRSAEIASWFENNSDKPFAVLIGTKLARLGNLLSGNKLPNNESIDDSFLDLATFEYALTRL